MSTTFGSKNILALGSATRKQWRKQATSTWSEIQMVQQRMIPQRTSKEQHFIQRLVTRRAWNAVTVEESNVATKATLLNHDPIGMCWQMAGNNQMMT